MADMTPQLAYAQPRVRTVTGWTIFFMVLLRIAIGWHFVYEGAWKLMQDDWRATGYLQASSGPLRSLFVSMIDDPDGLERLTADSVKQRMQQRVEVLIDHYALTAEQQKSLTEFAAAQNAEVDKIFADPDFVNQLTNYKQFLTVIAGQEAELLGPPPTFEPGVEYNEERLVYNYGKKSAARQALLARADKPISDVQNHAKGLLSNTQMQAGPPPKPTSQTWFIDWSNMLGLTAVGVCLMLGLFTRLAALGGVSLLMLYYFCMPPWPGLPEGPSEGHYLIINKNVIEALALLAIAASGVGRWGGLDAYSSAWIRRWRCPEPVGLPMPGYTGQR